MAKKTNKKDPVPGEGEVVATYCWADGSLGGRKICCTPKFIEDFNTRRRDEGSNQRLGFVAHSGAFHIPEPRERAPSAPEPQPKTRREHQKEAEDAARERFGIAPAAETGPDAGFTPLDAEGRAMMSQAVAASGTAVPFREGHEFPLDANERLDDLDYGDDEDEYYKIDD